MHLFITSLSCLPDHLTQNSIPSTPLICSHFFLISWPRMWHMEVSGPQGFNLSSNRSKARSFNSLCPGRGPNLHLLNDPSHCSWILNPQHHRAIPAVTLLALAFFITLIIITIYLLVQCSLSNNTKHELHEMGGLCVPYNTSSSWNSC